MQVFKDGIERTIRESQWQSYKDKGYVKIAENIEEQPEQDEVVEVDEFTISKPKAKPNKKK